MTSCIVHRLFSILMSLVILVVLQALLSHLILIELLLLLFLLLLGSDNLLLGLDELLDDGNVDVRRGTSCRIGLDQLLLNASKDTFDVHRGLEHAWVRICCNVIIKWCTHSLSLLWLIACCWLVVLLIECTRIRLHHLCGLWDQIGRHHYILGNQSFLLFPLFVFQVVQKHFS